MTITLGTITTKTFRCAIYQDDDGQRVFYTACAEIDADGANGQNGNPVAYRSDDKGLDALSSGGLSIDRSGKVVCSEEGSQDVAILGAGNEPVVLPDGTVPSQTWYVIPGKKLNDPAAFLDATTVPYVVVPPLVVHNTVGAVRGCKARVTWKGRVLECVVGDRGGLNRVGEISIAAAAKLGIPTSPRDGGVDGADVLYEVWPGVATPGYVLQPT
jgi:Fungal chitosanase of glycosyl hydrolase group 75